MTMMEFPKAFMAILMTAAATIAMTAGFRPEKIEATQADVPMNCVHIAEREKDKHAGNYEKRPGRDASRNLVKQPADVDCKLLGLGTGQEHAIIERIQEPLRAHPFSLLNQFLLHDGDLAGQGPPKLIKPSLTQKRRACRSPRPGGHPPSKGQKQKAPRGLNRSSRRL
jgi:hypothetical protein